MDRQGLMRELERIVAADDLSGEEIRLYILLLTNCLGSFEAIIKYSSIRNAFGGNLSEGKLANLCKGLANRDLIILKNPIPVLSAAEDFSISYIICAYKVN